MNNEFSFLTKKKNRKNVLATYLAQDTNVERDKECDERWQSTDK